MEYNWEGKTIIVAEDVQINFRLLEINLKKTKATIIWAKNGVAAVELVKNNEVNLVLMDIQMPIMNGYEATKKIKEIKPNLPVIAQTAFTMTNEKEESLKAGCDAYISKPINKVELLSTIDKYLSIEN